MHADTIAKIKQDLEREAQRTQCQKTPSDFPRLPDIPAGRYTRADFTQLEQEHLWPTTWLLAGHESEVASIGSFKLWNATGTEVIIVRGKDLTIRAFYNSCRHRGGAVVTASSGTKTALACSYHSWTYGLDGKLNFVPREYEFPGLDKEKKGLVPLRCEIWESLIFVNRDLNCAPLSDFLGPIMDDEMDIPWEDVTLLGKLEYDINCNWKCVQEAFSEGYHIPTVHQNTVAKVSLPEVMSHRMYPNGHNRIIARNQSGEAYEKARFFARNPTDDDLQYEITVEASQSYNIFPNIVLVPAMGHFPIILVWPTGQHSCHAEVYYFARNGNRDPDSESSKTVMEMFDFITREDLGALEPLQKSMKSGVIRGMTIGYCERLIYNFNEHIDRVLGLERIPADLAIPQILGPLLAQDSKERGLYVNSFLPSAEKRTTAPDSF